ncbi:tetratricopeptide repeat protein [Synechococcus sp. HK05]|uniref:tetratricopeptide repeat protein n=1 Tax=Synechococcus sp. HK05 TaxID=2725975 RepID=UPI001C3865EA|nr:tetratricopeptide repeat protein [Synechococcus sp. HK05]MBV2352631.1 tetratricopeptide repeat protein [Synechococcus sp. HK05]
MTGFGNSKKKDSKRAARCNRNELVEQALSTHRSGNVQAAEQLYRKIIEGGHKSATIFTNMGVICKETRRPEEAVYYYRLAISVDPEYSDAYANLGSIYHEQGKTNEAIKYTRRAIEINPENAVAQGNMGAYLKKANKLDEALTATQKSISINPGYGPAHLNLGLILMEANQPDKAKAAVEEAIRLMPSHCLSHLTLATIYKQLGQTELALRYTLKAIELDPSCSDAYSNLGILWHMMGRLKEAYDATSKAISLSKTNQMAFRSLGAICRDLGRLDEALIAASKAVELAPDDPIAHMNLGTIYGELCMHEEAELNTMRSIAIKPDNDSARFCLSLYQLIRNNYKEGWKNFGYRSSKNGKDNTRIDTFNRLDEWNGEKGNRVLITAEQGIGDQILFASMLSEMERSCSHVTVQVDRRLVPLFKRSFRGCIEILSEDDQVDHSDFSAQIAMGDLGKHFRQHSRTFTNQPESYLIPDKQRGVAFQDLMQGSSRRRKIGLSWKSYGQKYYNRKKCIPLSQIASHIAEVDADFVSLQYGDCAMDIAAAFKICNVSITEIASLNTMNDIDGLASLISACDAVITISNITAHLAGALGVETHLLVPASPHFYWGLGKSSTVWYQSVTIYRQTSDGDWSMALQELATNLRSKRQKYS